jgi:hypothetical protein
MVTQLSFWSDYCISLEQRSGGWFYSVESMRQDTPRVVPDGQALGPFPSDSQAIEAARLMLVKDKNVY